MASSNTSPPAPLAPGRPRDRRSDTTHPWGVLARWQSGAAPVTEAARAAIELGLEELARDLGSGEAAGGPRAQAIHQNELIACARRRAATARCIGFDAAALADRWTLALDADFWRTADANVVRRDSTGVWRGLSDLVGAANSAHLPDALRQPYPKPVVIHGLATPTLLERVWRATPITPDGYRPLILVVAASEDELAQAMAVSECEGVWSDSRVVYFAGDDQFEALRVFLEGRLGSALPSTLLRTPTPPDTGVRDAGPLVAMLERMAALQQNEHVRLIERVRSGATGAACSERFASPGPLRFLIPTTRYSTFIRHSASDLAGALRELGHGAEVLMETSDDARLVTVGYLRAIERVRPDAVILINYLRSQLGGAMPSGIPVVTWVQDHMPHLMDPRVADTLGPLDFLVGHMHEAFFKRTRLGCERARFLFVPASERTFHAGPCDPALEAELACDIAYVSHQSETPRALHDRLRSAFAGSPAAVRMIDAIAPDVLRSGDGVGAALRLRSCATVAALWRERGIEPDPVLSVGVQGSYVAPMIERCARHATLEWAAAIADRRGLTLRLHGNGWDAHPMFARFAAPALDHAEPLRTLYRVARVNLHASAATNAHQRIAECALSGGLMLRRGPCPDTALLRRHAERLMATHFTPEHGGDAADPRSVQTYRVRHPLAPDPARFWPLFEGAPDDDGTRAGAEFFLTARRGVIERAPRLPDVPIGAIPDYAFPSARETLFHDAASLEAMIVRAGDDAWRRRTIEGHRAAAERCMTYRSAAGSIVDMLRSALGCADRSAA